MKRHSFLESLKRLISELPGPTPAMADAPVHFSSSGGGGGRFDDTDSDYYDDVPDEPTENPRRQRRDTAQPTAARRRTVQSEPDDRYWTDYLRIALPVIGLLLVIAVFWYWAQQLIDDPGDEDLTATQPGIAEVADSEPEDTEPEEPADVGTPEPSDANAADQGEQVAPPTQAPVDDQEQEATMPTPTPSPEPDQGEAPPEGSDTQVENVLAGLTAPEGIEPDMNVVVTEDNLNVRSESSAAGGDTTIIDTLDTGDTLTTVSGPIEAGDFTWWEVVVDATGEVGFVVEDFIEPAN